MSVLPFDQRDGFIWMNGSLVPWKDAKLHVLSHGLHYASCVFEGERAYSGKIFKITEHSERFRKSAELLDFEIPYSVAELDAAKRLTVEKNGFQNCYVRPVAWRGSEMMAVAAQHATINVAIAVWDWPSMFDVNEKMRGIKLDIRGAPAGQVRVLLDGVALGRASDSVVNLADLPAELVDRIEVYRGFAPAGLSPSSAAGVVNVVTKDPAKPTAGVAAGGGSFGTARANAMGAGPLAGGNASAFASWRRTDGDFDYRDDNGTRSAYEVNEAFERG